jgi:hypothetical protein
MKFLDPVTQFASHRALAAAVAATGTVALSAGALAAPAGAQTISVNRACFVNANPAKGAAVGVSGSGFTPGDSVALQATGVSGTITVGADGTFSTVVPGPTLGTAGPAQRKFTLNARDETNGVTAASTTLRVANLAFSTQPAQAKPSTPVTFHFSGFRGGQGIYGHFIHGHVTITHKFGRATGPCGMLKAKSRLFPGGRPRFQHYKVQFDDARRYSRRSRPNIVTGINIQVF